MSKSATIQLIKEVSSIPGADRIEQAKVLGWNVIIPKGLYKLGDAIVYVEVDSLLPMVEKYAYVKNTKKDETGTEYYYVRNVRMKGVLSQGLIISTEDLGGGVFEIGQDVSEILGIKHYEKPVPVELAGTVLGNFPSFLSKTDENRIQNIPEVLESIKGKPYYISVKQDGTSFSCFYKDGKFGVCSRNLELKEDHNNAYWKMVEKYKLKEVLEDLYKVTGEEFLIQGELCGQKIQCNPMQLKELDLFLFNIISITHGLTKVSLGALMEISKKYNLKTVSIIEIQSSFNYSQEELLELSKGLYEGTNTQREGIVIRTQDSTISFKVINNDYKGE